MAHKDRAAQKGNPVAKHARTFNLAHTFVDRKRKQAKGYTKHKKGAHNYDS